MHLIAEFVGSVIERTASLGANKFLLAVPQSRIFDSVRLLEVSPTDGRGCRAEC